MKKDRYDSYDDIDDEELYDTDLADAGIGHGGRMRVAAGVMDFLGVISGMVVVLAMVALLIMLGNWLISDMSNTFTLIQTKIQ